MYSAFIEQIVREGDCSLLSCYCDHIPSWTHLLKIKGVHINTVRWSRIQLSAEPLPFVGPLQDGLPIELVKKMVATNIISIINVPVTYLPNGTTLEVITFLDSINASKGLKDQVVKYLSVIKTLPNESAPVLVELEIYRSILSVCKDLRVVDKILTDIMNTYADESSNITSYIFNSISDVNILEYALSVWSRTTHREIMYEIICVNAMNRGFIDIIKAAAKHAPKHVLRLHAKHKGLTCEIVKWMVETGIYYSSSIRLNMIVEPGITKEWLIDKAGCSRAEVELAYAIVENTTQEIPCQYTLEPSSLLGAAPSVELAKKALSLGAQISYARYMPMRNACQSKNRELLKYLCSKGGIFSFYEAISEDREFTEWVYNNCKDNFNKGIYTGKLVQYNYLNILISEIILGIQDHSRYHDNITRHTEPCKLLLAVVPHVISQFRLFNYQEIKVRAKNHRWFKRRHTYVLYRQLPTTYKEPWFSLL